jgi:phosphotransferase system HPr-like phosphotransfer protein
LTSTRAKYTLGAKIKGGIIMKSVNISFKSFEKVQEFVNVITNCEGNFDLVSGRYLVDAKSIMGIYSLNLTNVLRLDIHNDEVADKVIPALKDFVVA